jgi:germination protein M
MAALLAGPDQAERAAQMSSAVPTGSRLLHLSIASGIARADFNTQFASGAGALSAIARVDQVVYTLTQFPTVQKVLFLVNGKVARTFTSEGLVFGHPVGRADERSLLPPIFIERPALGDTLRSPFRLSGLANTFEAVFQVLLVDATGHTVVSRVVHASAGTGTWGSFSLSIAFFGAHPGMGRLIAFERSAKNGRPIHLVQIPIRIAT